jgi:hypothetical protein
MYNQGHSGVFDVHKTMRLGQWSRPGSDLVFA